MNAPQKIEKAKEPETLRIWNAVCKTDPKHTKAVEFGRKFTAIDAHYQIQEATRLFGPIGEGWGYVTGMMIFEDGLVIVPVTLWHGDRNKSFGPIYGSTTMRDRKGNIDKDAPKKATTDALTKALSQLGFNADVFLGLFDDNKYVAAVQEEFHPKTDEPKPGERHPGENFEAREKLEGPYTSGSALRGAIKAFAGQLSQMNDLGEFAAWMGSPDVVELEKQALRYLPGWWDTGEGCAKDFEPMTSRIHRKRKELEEIENIHENSGAKYVNAG
jgi:hypothetical protein